MKIENENRKRFLEALGLVLLFSTSFSLICLVVSPIESETLRVVPISHSLSPSLSSSASRSLAHSLAQAQNHQSATVGLAQSHSRIRSGDIRSDADVVVQPPLCDPLILAQAPSHGRRWFLLRSSPSVLTPPLPVKSRPSGPRSSSGQVLSGIQSINPVYNLLEFIKASKGKTLAGDKSITTLEQTGDVDEPESRLGARGSSGADNI